MNLTFFEPSKRGGFDLILAVCGYESRSRHMLDVRRDVSSRKVAVGYAAGEEAAFEENQAAFCAAGFSFESVPDYAYETYIESLVRSVRNSNAEAIKVLIDISCFTRLRLAQTVEALFESGPFELEVFYSLASFSKPPIEEPQNEYLCPVTEYLSGWTGDAEKAVVLLSGLGYEQMMALGIIEHIDPYDLWLFSPSSPIKSYDDEVLSANRLLISSVSDSNIIGYPVMQGDVVLAKLLSLVDSVRGEFRCMLMPLGPKVFAFACMVVGCIYRDVSVWRASAGIHSQPRDRMPSGITSSFRISFTAKKLEEAGLDEGARSRVMESDRLIIPE
ncbi:hypothetical protein [Xanthomonas sp. 3058]|uniref:hypothetical protein n=1 Tax=Xanthomonas sp. 3058 TaxID=3035314 RepID=UPI001612C884|nr:hypothetical protein [Xanthomonas sp. 3058]MBB5865094.1 hypothetical protein [Xanthomonas sp. 3058]